MIFHVMLCLLCGNSSSHDSLDFIFHFLNVHSNEVKKEKKSRELPHLHTYAYEHVGHKVRENSFLHDDFACKRHITDCFCWAIIISNALNS